MLVELEISNCSIEMMACGCLAFILARDYCPSWKFLTAIMMFHPPKPANLSTMAYPMPLLLPVTMILRRASII